MRGGVAEIHWLTWVNWTDSLRVNLKTARLSQNGVKIMRTMSLGARYGALAGAAALVLSASPVLGSSSAASDALPAGTISEVGGGVGGPGPAASVAIVPCGVTTTPVLCGMAFGDGHLYFTDIGTNNVNSPPPQDVIRSIDLATGRLTTPAGNGAFGLPSDGQLATAAALRAGK